MLTQERLRELFSYDPETGCFTRLVATCNRVKIGDVSGCDNGKGYLRIDIDGATYLSNRLAFLYMTGSLPKNHTDHINGKRNDNRWENLRDVTQQENNKNKKLGKTNTSGVMGVSFVPSRKKWAAQINVSGKNKNLGRFIDFFEACCARKSAEAKFNYYPNHGRAI